MTDNFLTMTADTMTIPAVKAVAVAKSDTVEIAVPRALFIGTGGNLNVKLRDDSTAVLFKNVPDATILPIRVKLVLLTDTTAADIVALY